MTIPGSLGQHAAEGAVSFRCAACGEIAAVVRAVPAGGQTDLGPTLGPQAQDRDGIVVDYFGGTLWKHAEARFYQAVCEILGGDTPDPEALRRFDWEFAPFYCTACEQNFCRADWHSVVLFDEGFYDCTMGRCPRGHEQMIDD
jgi:hypothetical protein